MSTVSEHVEAPQTRNRQEVLRRALVELKAARAELADERRRRTEPIAVVGAGCRFPGGTGVAGFWDLLARGGSGIGVVPQDRWNVGEMLTPDAAGRMYSRHAGLVDGITDFDAGLFGIPPREAASMDPQHRMMLEVTWEALEYAGIAPDGLRGSRTGVFIGAGPSDYEHANLLGADMSAINGYTATGNAPNFIANRISYTLGLEGPSLVVDTACSSSLVAVHLAVQSLRSGECDLAIVGGVNLLMSPIPTLALCEGRMLSATGQCHTFDTSADGYVRGEGCGVVVLRRQAQAQTSNEHIHATILGSATNQDGRSSGITVPNAAAQQDVIRRALAAAGVSGADVGYVEAHGTGTPLGDPIEMRALARVLGRDRERPLMVGSVKTNIGHLEAAAGIAGLIKTILAVERGIVPPHLNLSRPSPHIAWDELPVRVPTEATPWNEERRIAGVSSFGFGGTNAHVIVESPPRRDREPAAPPPGTPVVTKITAAGPDALRASARRLADFVANCPELSHADVAWAAGTGRAELSERAAVVAATTGELLAGLRAVAEDRTPPRVTRARRIPGTTARVAFVASRPDHPGIRGARTVEALTGLAGSSPAVSKLLGTLTEVLGPLPELPEDSPLPAYAMTVAVGEWWRSVGVAPDLVAGRGVGGYAAAALAGVFSPEDGARLVAARAAPDAAAATADVLEEIRLSTPDADVLIDGARPDVAAPSYWLDRACRPIAPGEAEELDQYVEVDLDDPELARADARTRLLDTLASVWSVGVKVDWTAVNPPAARPPRLPTYPFRRTSYPLPEPSDTTARPGNPMRPRLVEPATGGVIAETTLTLGSLPFLGEHRVHGRLVVPGVVLIELVLQAGERLLGDGPSIENLTISRPLVLADDDERAVQVILEPGAAGDARARVFAEDGSGEWRLHLEARVVPVGSDATADRPRPVGDFAAARERCGEALDHDAFYRRAWHPSFELGDSFRLVRTARRGRDAAVARLARPDPGCAGIIAGVRPELLTLDACVQLVPVAAQPGDTAPDRPVMLGTGYERIALHRPDLPEDVTCTAVTGRGDDGSAVGDLRLTDTDGTLVAEMLGVTFRPVAAQMLERLLGGAPGAAAPGIDVARLREAGARERRARVLEHLVRLVAGILGATPRDVEPRAPLPEYADSLMLTELQTAVERDLGVKVALESLFEDGRLTALAELIADELGKRPEPRRTGARLRPMSVAEMSERARLDPSITAHGDPEPAATAPGDVLLTGATGFVGAFLLGELLRRGDGRVHCLVRADDEAHALRRVLANLERYGVDVPRSRIAPVVGDLGEPRFGMDERSFAALHDRIGAIYHCGAMVKWTYPYNALEPANVDGTREALRLATAGGVPRPVHFVSTVGVFSSREFTAGVVRETDDLLTSGPLVVGYAQTKWVAEHMVRTAAERGVPVTIHRVNTGGHSVTGAFNRLDHLCMMIKGCVEAGIAPEHVAMPLQPAPVDYVAGAIAELGSRPDLHGRTFHLVNPAEMSWPAFFDVVEEYGYPLERLPFDAWRERIKTRGSGTTAMLGLVPFLEGAVDDVRLPLSDSARTRDALAGTGITCPPLGPALIRTYLDTFVSGGFIDPPPSTQPRRSHGDLGH